MDDASASRTAVLVCQGRAVADGLMSPDRFSDPVAASLLTPEEAAEVERARESTPPSEPSNRLVWERLRACAEGMVPRTIAIDSAISAAGHRQVVILGAGLDSRPWRLSGHGDVQVFCVDHPASQAECRRRAHGLGLVVARVEFVPVNLSTESLGLALANAGHDSERPTTWVWEGVVPYLTRDQVENTLWAISQRSAPGSAVLVQYQDRSAIARVGRRLSAFAARRAGIDDPLANEPWRSLWTAKALAALLGRHSFRVERDEDLLTIARRVGSPTTHDRSLANGRVAVARRVV